MIKMCNNCKELYSGGKQCPECGSRDYTEAPLPKNHRGRILERRKKDAKDV